jgi:hypothetical protein
MTSSDRRDPLSHRYYRARWTITDSVGQVAEGPQPLELRIGKATQRHYEYPPFQTTGIRENSRSFDYPSKSGRCIYCGAETYSAERAKPLGEEHIIPEGIGGPLILRDASCKECETIIGKTESKIINGIFAAPRRFLSVSTGSKGLQSRVKLKTIVNGNVKEVHLPLSEHPVILTLPQLMAPGVLYDRLDNESGIGGLWTKGFNFDPEALASAERKEGVIEFDGLRFAHLLAKIAHSYACAVIGLERMRPTLTEFVRTDFPADSDDTSCYRWVGGSPILEQATENLHEIGVTAVGYESLIYVAVRIRLFASLGAPTYYVIPGYLTSF